MEVRKHFDVLYKITQQLIFYDNNSNDFPYAILIKPDIFNSVYTVNVINLT